MRILKLISLSVMFWICYGCTIESAFNGIEYVSCLDAEEYCPESILIEEILLTEETNTFFHFEKEDTLVFKNILGETLEFKVSQSADFNVVEPANTRLLCRSCEKDSQYEFYNVEHSDVSFFSVGEHRFSSFSIYAATKRRYDSSPENLLFFEKIKISAGGPGIYENLSILKNTYEITDTFPAYFLSQNNNYRFFNTLGLMDQNFEDVYTNINNEKVTIYFSFSKGVIGFDFEGEFWLFDRIK